MKQKNTLEQQTQSHSVPFMVLHRSPRFDSRQTGGRRGRTSRARRDVLVYSGRFPFSSRPHPPALQPYPKKSSLEGAGRPSCREEHFRCQFTCFRGCQFTCFRVVRVFVRVACQRFLAVRFLYLSDRRTHRIHFQVEAGNAD